MRFAYSLLALAIIVFCAGCGQEDSSKLAPADYLGQTPPGTTAVTFAFGIVSTRDHEHSRLEFGKDGRELYWVVVPVDSSNILVQGTPFKIHEQTIRYSVYDGQSWSTPDTLPFDLKAKQSPAYSIMGEALYFGSVVSDSNLTRRYWRTSRSNGGWSTPMPVSKLPLPPRSASFCFAANGNVYFDSFAGINEQGRPSWYIYMAEFKDGEFSEPRLLGGGINDGSVNWTPWIAPDESYLIFSSHRGGGGDLYISFRDDSGDWSRPVNMGPSVNTDAQERFPSVSPDGKYLFFARNTEDAYSDIFWVSAAFIEDLKSGE